MQTMCRTELLLIHICVFVHYFAKFWSGKLNFEANLGFSFDFCAFRLCFCCCRVVFRKQIVGNWKLREYLPPLKLGFFTLLLKAWRFQWSSASFSSFVEALIFLQMKFLALCSDSLLLLSVLHFWHVFRGIAAIDYGLKSSVVKMMAFWYTKGLLGFLPLWYSVCL